MVTHPAYWEIGATVDHVVPVTRGGADDESNCVTTSMARDRAKMQWTLEELGWTMQPPGRMADWDGLMRWFLEFTGRHPETLAPGSVRAWHQAATVALAAGTVES